MSIDKKIATRQSYGEALKELGKENKDIVVLDADLSSATKTNIFAKEFPERFFDMGISEQDMIGTAAGFATCGKIPYASTFAMFAAGRAYDQIRNSVCYPNLNVKICATHAGITVGEDGATHQMLEDISLMRSIPNMTVISTSDDVQTKWAVKEISKINGPCYLRLSRLATPIVYEENQRFEIGKGVLIGSGTDATIFATGVTVVEALKAKEILEEKGINVRVADIHTIKPIDKNLIVKCAKETKKLNRNKKGYVEFKNVSFRYPDADTEILNDITFTAEPGKTTAIIGSTGSGKSTIVNLIPRFYDVTGGELLIDGVNIKDIDIKTLRDIIGFVPQKGVLFSGTIESNIKYSDKNMSDERMIEAARIAQAEEFINTKKEKYNSEIAQGGNNVSGGQKQRLSIARAIAKNPEIFVFDDSFSALDFKTDVKLRTALSEKTKDKTVIIVAQRISTILNADQIIVLDDGNIVGIGTHEELMKNNETYKEIALSQLSKEELE